MSRFQSGFKSCHNTGTALLRFFNDLILTVNSGDSAVLVLLDLMAAFDTVDHAITGEAYLTDRSFSVYLGDYSSGTAPPTCGVPQGHVLGPILFYLYMLPLSSSWTYLK